MIDYDLPHWWVSYKCRWCIKIKSFKFWVLVTFTYKSTNVSDTSQKDVIIDEMAALALIKDTTKAVDLLKGKIGTLNWWFEFDKSVGYNNTMVGSQKRLIELIQEEANKVGNNSVIQYHCLIH